MPELLALAGDAPIWDWGKGTWIAVTIYAALVLVAVVFVIKDQGRGSR